MTRKMPLKVLFVEGNVLEPNCTDSFFYLEYSVDEQEWISMWEYFLNITNLETVWGFDENVLEFAFPHVGFCDASGEFGIETMATTMSDDVS